MASKCCSCSLQTGVTTLAIFHIVAETIATIFLVQGLTAVAQEKNNSSSSDGAILATLIVALIIVVAYLAVCIVLLVGAIKRHYGKCKLWYVVTQVLLVITTIGSLYQILQVGSLEGGDRLALKIFIGMVVKIVFIGWQLRVVHLFMDEIKNEDTSGDGFNHLKLKEEV